MLAALNGTDAAIEVATIHGGTVQEIQQVVIDASGTAAHIDSNFTLGFRGLVTDKIRFTTDDCTAAALEIDDQLERLAAVGEVTVDVVTDSGFVCGFDITFVSNAGDLELLSVSAPGMSSSSTDVYDSIVASATDGALPAGSSVSTSTLRHGTSVTVGGEFAVGFQGQRSGYLSSDVDADGMKAALEALSTIGHVNVQRSDVDENGGYTWTVEFQTELGDVVSIDTDDVTLTGSLPTAIVMEHRQGVSPPFSSGAGGLSLGSVTVTDLSLLEYTITGLKQGVVYSVRVAATNAIGFGPASIASPPFIAPLPRKFHAWLACAISISSHL